MKNKRNKRRRIKNFRQKEQLWLINAPHNKQMEIPTDLSSLQFQIAIHLFYSYLCVPLKNAFTQYSLDDPSLHNNFFKDLWTVLYLKDLSNVEKDDKDKNIEDLLRKRYLL